MKKEQLSELLGQVDDDLLLEADRKRKQPRRKQASEEEQIRALKKRMRVLIWILIASVAVIIALTIPAVRYILEQTISMLPGQNYTVAGG